MKRIENLDELLLADNKNGSIIEIDSFISNIEWNEMTEPQKVFYCIQELEREVNNGGFNQYFINLSGDYAHETIKSLHAIGANTTAVILQRAIDQFPDHRVPKDRHVRI